MFRGSGFVGFRVQGLGVLYKGLRILIFQLSGVYSKALKP